MLDSTRECRAAARTHARDRGRASRRRAALAFVLAEALVFAQAASAQESARELFDSALGAAERSDYGRARDLFRRSLEVEPRPVTAENLALVLRALGQTLEAVEVIDSILEGEFGPVEAEHQRALTALRDEALREMGTVELTVHGAAAFDVRVDGRLAAPRSRGHGELRLPADSGRHVVVVTASDGRSAEERVDVPRGGVVALAVRLPPALDLPAADREPGLAESPWTWVVVGAVVAVGATVAILLATVTTEEFVADPVWGRRVGISF